MNSPGVAPQFGEATPLPPAAPTPAAFVLVRADAGSAALGAAAEPAEVIQPGVGPLHDPPLANLDRRRCAAESDLAEQASLVECFSAAALAARAAAAASHA